MKQHLEGTSVQQESTETLRQILERQYGKPVTDDEALGIGESLIDFFEALGSNDPEGEDNDG